MIFIEQNDQAIVMNSTMEALRQAQNAFAGEAEKEGLRSEDDVVQMMREFRQERFAGE